ncbi:MAG: hypothetical protein ABEJ42_05030 [Halobacteriaceae archaeon]
MSLLVGGLAIHLGATIVASASTYPDAVLTALVGAVVWALLDPVPVLGTVLAPVAYVVVLKWRYPVGWLRAVLLGVAAWAAAVLVMAALALVGVGSLEALGVPGA